MPHVIRGMVLVLSKAEIFSRLMTGLHEGAYEPLPNVKETSCKLVSWGKFW